MSLESFLIGSNEHILCNIKEDDNYLYTFCHYLYIPSSEKLYTYYLLHFPLHCFVIRKHRREILRSKNGLLCVHNYAINIKASKEYDMWGML